MADLSLGREVDSAKQVIDLAASLAASGQAADGEFHLCLLDLNGIEQARVLTNADTIAQWNPDCDCLPTPSSGVTRWRGDLQREEAAVRAICMIREQMRGAWRSGSVSLADAMRLVAEAGMILDPAEDEI